MVKKTLFEIPVYSMSEKEFNRRWDKLDRKLRETYTTSSHHEEDRTTGLAGLANG